MGYKERKEGKAKRTEAYQYLIDKGMAPHLVAGVIGNLMQESYSHLDSTAVSSVGAIGIAQWHKSRRDNLIKYAKNKGKDYQNFNLQLDFLHHELTAPGAGAWRNNSEKERFYNSKTVEEASNRFSKYFERPGTAEANNTRRVKLANVIYAEQNDNNVYSKTDRGIVSIPPEKATEEDLKYSDAYKKEFYSSIIREEPIKEGEGLAPKATREAKEALQGKLNEEKFIEEITNPVEETPEQPSEAEKQQVQRKQDLLSQMYDKEKPAPVTRQTQAPTPNQEANPYGSIAIPENELYGSIIPEEFGGDPIKLHEGGNIPPHSHKEDAPSNLQEGVPTPYFPETSEEVFQFGMNQPRDINIPVEDIAVRNKLKQEEFYNVEKSVKGLIVQPEHTFTKKKEYNTDEMLNTLGIAPGFEKRNYETNNTQKLDTNLPEPILKEIKKKSTLAEGITASKLIKGNDGADVAIVQQMLVDEGFLAPTFSSDNRSSIDGKFGKYTKEAVEAFQEAKGLTKDGIIGKNTLAALKGFEVRNIKSVVEALKVKKAPASFIKQVEDNNKEQGVSQIQPIIPTTLYDETKKKIVPLFIRQYLHNISGGSDDITEKDLNKGELDALTGLVKMNLEKGRTNIDYPHYKEFKPGKGNTIDEAILFDDPLYSIEKTIGGGQILVEEGKVYVTDTYDWSNKDNNAKNTKQRDSEGLLKKREDLPWTNSIYRMARNYAAKHGNKSGGSKSKIYIGELKDLT